MLCNNLLTVDIQRVARCQLKGNLNTAGFFKTTSYVGHRKQPVDSHAAVVAHLSVPSPPKLALAAAFPCVEISLSIMLP